MRFVLDPVSLMLDVPALYVWPIACARMCVYVAACMRGPLSVAVCVCVCVCTAGCAACQWHPVWQCEAACLAPCTRGGRRGGEIESDSLCYV